MESQQSTSAPSQFRDAWGIRLKLLKGDLDEFLRELPDHPTAMLGGIVTLIYVLAAILAPSITSHDPTKGDLQWSLIPPWWHEQGRIAFPLGTDFQGRDLLTRIVYGARISLWTGFLAVAVSVAVGTALGCIAGYYRGWIDRILSRLADVLLGFPALIFAIGVMAFLGPGFANLIAALTFKGWVEFFRLARGEVMAEKSKEYVEAAKMAGQSNPTIIASEILPNVAHSISVLAVLRMGYMIVYEASLSFVGLGVQPPTPAWGSMINEGRDFMFTHWWLSTLPGLAMIILIVSLNLFGEGLRDILDPRLRIE